MIDDVSSGLDRNFLIAYFLPAIVLLAGGTGLFVYDSLVSDGILSKESIEGAAGAAFDHYAVTLVVVSLAAWLVAATLQTINATLVRWMEGWYLRRFEALTDRRRRQFGKRLDAIAARDGHERERLIVRTIAEYPCDFDPRPPGRAAGRPRMKLIERKLRPFKLGNVVESIGSYPYKLYGMSAQTCWPRLAAVLPDGCRRRLDTTKAHLDFMANLWLVWWLLLAEAAALLVLWRRWEYAVFILAAAISIAWLTRLTRIAAKDWGNAVRTSFDIGRHYLARELGIAIPSSVDGERAMWRRLSHPMFVQMHVTDSLPPRPTRRRPVGRRETPMARVGTLPTAGSTRGHAPPGARQR